jgi:hypothetical protein
LRDKLAVCLSKTQNDDKLIAALRKELVAATGGNAGAGRFVWLSTRYHAVDILPHSISDAKHLPRLATVFD